MAAKETINIFWFRRDLRIEDNHALFEALTSGHSVLPVFIFDSKILNDLEDNDPRVGFIRDEVNKLKNKFEKHGSSLWIYHGKPVNAFKRLMIEYDVKSVFTNRDYEPYATERDETIRQLLEEENIQFFDFKDQLVFDRNEIVKKDGKPYTVFTPYSKSWVKRLKEEGLMEFPSEKRLDNLLKCQPFKSFKLRDLGFGRNSTSIPPQTFDESIIANYAKDRDYPGMEATTKLGIHLRFGTISIRKLTTYAANTSSTFLNELIWRNFYMDILWHFPHVEKSSFKKAYDSIPWLNSEKDFKRWCEGTTGYPLVDAGMRQLNQTGFMHNRVRMVTASFLCKHLLIDWRWGEAYFASKLLDYELASNNGGWQWAAGTGCDAAPYFRVFNPELQAEKFDPESVYIKKWVPEFNTPDYPAKMIDHQFARKRAIETYQKAIKKGG